MALKPDPNDPNREEVEKHINKLQKKDTAQAKDQLAKEFNMGNGVIKKPSTTEQAKLNK